MRTVELNFLRECLKITREDKMSKIRSSDGYVKKIPIEFLSLPKFNNKSLKKNFICNAMQYY